MDWNYTRNIIRIIVLVLLMLLLSAWCLFNTQLPYEETSPYVYEEYTDILRY